MSALLDTSSSLLRAWTRLYTRGLPEEHRASRIAEIESDLWEQCRHQGDALVSPADTGFEVLVRLMAGMPADLAWRSSVRSAHRRARIGGPGLNERGRKMSRRIFSGAALALTVVIGLFMIWNGIGMFLSDQGWTWSEAWWGFSEIGSGIILFTGLALFGRSPRVASGLIVGAALATAAIHFWLLPIGLPIAAVIIGGVVVRNRGAGSPALTPGPVV